MILVILATIVDFVIFVAILNFLRFHIGLIINNYTTLEMLEMRRNARDEEMQESPYNLGAYYNWMQVFGKNWWIWPIPIFLSSGGPLGDGIIWPKASPEG